MTEQEAIEIMEEVKALDDSLYAYDPAYMEALEIAISASKEVQRYRKIGTAEECREAVEKQKPKKPLGGVDIAGNEYMICSYCSAIVEDGEWRADYCPDCGQAIRWDENLE